MANFKVIAGQFGVGRSGRAASDFWFGRAQAIRMPAASGGEDQIPADALTKVAQVSASHVASVAARLGGARDGDNVGGGVHLGGKDSATTFAGLVFADGRKALVQCESNDFRFLASIALNNQQNLAQPKDWRHFARIGSLVGSLVLGLVLFIVTRIGGGPNESASAILAFAAPLLLVAAASLIKPVFFLPKRGHAVALIVGLITIAAGAASYRESDASASVTAPPIQTFASVLAKIPDHTTLPMTREGYPDTFRQLGSDRFAVASNLLPWAARAVALSEHCPTVTNAALLPRSSTREALVFFIDCGYEDAVHRTRFYITEAQAVQFRSALERLAPDDSVGEIAPPPRAQDMFRYTNLDAWSACNETARNQMRSRSSFQAGAWPGLVNATPEFDGSLAVESSYSAVNAFNARLDGSYSCTVNLGTGQITRFRIG